MKRYKKGLRKFRQGTLFCVFIFLTLFEFSEGIKWLALGKGNILWNSRSKATQCKTARREYGLVRQQTKICRTTFEAMPQIVKAIDQTLTTCQTLFEKRRWNCSTILTAPSFTPDLTTGTREQAYVYALSSASVAYSISRACASGALFNCSCSAHPKDPPNGNFKWGGCGDNVRWAVQFAKHFTDTIERKTEKKKASMKTKRGSVATAPEHSLDVIMGSMGNNKIQSKSHLAVVNLQNNKAGRKAVEMSLKTQCKCHGVSGSCSIKICWKALPKFIEVGERLQRKYGSSIEVTPRKIGYGRKLVPVGPNQYYYNNDDLVYVTKSPDYCLRDDKTGSLGTRGRPCNKTSTDYDSCEIMCCGRGHVTLTVQKIEMCRCKFHWCCTVVCKKCMHWVDTHICN